MRRAELRLRPSLKTSLIATISTDANGNTTRYVYDGKGNVTETIDALGNSALFEYDSIGNLVKTSLHRVDTQDNVDEWEVTLYEFDGRGLTTKQVDALGNVTTYAYDGNGNLVSKTDPDGYTTEYTYNALDLVTSINYNDAKEVSYRYNATGDLVSMTDWLGSTTFELDLLHRLTAATDHAGNRVEYTYDGVGNQTSIVYPDATTATYDYDLMGNQTKITETDGSETEYTYDGMGRATEMRYPNGWVEYYTYDAMGRILKVEDTHPSEKPAKTQKHTYRYDANGNMTYEYMRGNGTGQAKNETLYTYDALNRLISAHDNYGNSTRTYTYDSLGNLTFETGNGSHNMDYRYNNLNQLVEQSDDGWKTYTASAYDKRGNLVLEEYYKNKNTTNTIGQYTFDATNKMVRGINAAGEESLYTYNGLGALMENTWIIAQNGYGYHGVNAGTSDNGSINGQGNGNSSGNTKGNNGNGNVKKTASVIKQFVVDFTSETYKPLMEHEVNGLDYRYVYSDKARLSVVVQGIENGSASVLDSSGELHAYYHCDYLGTTDYLTSAVNSKIISWTSYNEWGEITHNAVLKCGQRELDMVKRYATHDYDSVLGQYYAKARFYDAGSRRFTAMDPIKDGLNWYAYCENNPVVCIDEFGLVTRYVSADSVRMRAGAGLSYTTLYYLNKNTEVDYLLQKKSANGYNWAKVKYNGQTGWIADKYLRLSKDYSVEYDKLYGILKEQYPALYLDVFSTRYQNVKNALANNKEIIISVANKYGIPAEMLAAVIVKEQMTQSASDDILYTDTLLRGSAHSFGLGAIFPQTAYDAWVYLAANGLTDTAFRDFYEDVYILFELKDYDISNPSIRNIVLGAKLAYNNSFNIETIAVVLRYYYELFKNNYRTYEEYYFELFSCSPTSVTRADNVWLVSNINAGFTHEIYGHILSYYNTGKDYIYKSGNNKILRNDAGIKYANYTREYLDTLKTVLN